MSLIARMSWFYPFLCSALRLISLKCRLFWKIVFTLISHLMSFVGHCAALFLTSSMAFCVLAYAKEIDEHKRTMLLVNKADLLPLNIRSACCSYDLIVYYLYCLSSDVILHLFNAGRDGLIILRHMIFSTCSGRLRLPLPH